MSGGWHHLPERESAKEGVLPHLADDAFVEAGDQAVFQGVCMALFSRVLVGHGDRGHGMDRIDNETESKSRSPVLHIDGRRGLVTRHCLGRGVIDLTGPCVTAGIVHSADELESVLWQVHRTASSDE